MSAGRAAISAARRALTLWRRKLPAREARRRGARPRGAREHGRTCISPAFEEHQNHIKIEGVTYTDTDPYDDDQDVDAFGDFDEVTRTVTIMDGKLTLSPSSGCYNTKLMFIEVTPLSGGGGTATPGLAAATYKYDALGRRLQKTVGAVATTFVHDGDQVVAEYEGSTLKRRYIYGTYIDEPLAVVTAAGTQYYHQSRIYSVMALSNQSGQLAERYGCTPYGKRRVVSPGGSTLAASAVGNQVGFTGRYHDGETGLTYFRARYQDAELGRFVGRDPIGYTEGLHLYAYVGNQPSSYVDPTGLFWGEVGKIAVGAVVGLIVDKIWNQPPDCVANAPSPPEKELRNCSINCYLSAPAGDERCSKDPGRTTTGQGNEGRTVDKDCVGGKWKIVAHTSWSQCDAVCPPGFNPG